MKFLSLEVIIRKKVNPVSNFSGTLDSIEKYNINENRWELVKVNMPLPLRRFCVAKVANNMGLIIGGVTKYSKES